jgi:carboxylate-amine ligase
MPNERKAPSFGIEEEFFLVDRRTRDIPAQPPADLLQAAREALGERLAEEMFQSQLELVSPVLWDLAEARACLLEQRTRLAQVAAGFGLGLVCAGSHPFADWSAKQANTSARYRQLFDDYRLIAQRCLLCGLHVHVGIPPEEDRVRVMNRVLPWLPLLLVLSTSSPFWLGRPSGCMSYRQVICGEWPRMGLPDEHFPDEPAFEAYVQWLLASGSIRTENDIWWCIRPSARFPTLELRVTDACPSVEDALCIAGLFRALVAGAMSGDDSDPLEYPLQRLVLAENYWRARHLGIHAMFIDDTGEASLSAGAWLARAHAFCGAQDESMTEGAAFARARHILRYGSNADRQLQRYREALDAGLPKQQALVAVVDGLLAESCGG